ncbi:MAG: V-type H(+)-translocating pyrophosphatase [Gammaproteobacteria bacterium]|jgi:K(+)-stimulated pyrophosphate-energized sodium pump|uniref:Putative K(+)-stimulated pyrophosphate-energized sodium pump n=4 Tax=OM182 clade TaxID=745002 RepID=A0A0R2T8N5_9GAMM|nr:MAG: potassium transporter [OM182 bacterium BACL3 MAG-120619-bin3]MBT3521175.1 V-type H(+)-translocating pyrophosphatase [Gammaproteobacteria bacterium]MBT4782672.1 V-type H(+)-translocating pyrophosphatase [Gammaproteobacteria bacterium]MBT5907232.1 V-type H(+)-translocating pyrophosphatase [Gammaproteobacteria bacterium]MBT6315949.1 V-type H(+)-translocating pyrophosphatase [Gammaproteobacteria bacterium]|tara:strand:- start:1958 stop:4087 length:2130 start_codon:yes stop_codon:yes gene_type:complete
MASTTILITVALSLLGLAIALFYMKKVNDVPVDMGLEPDQSERLKFIHTAIADGAMAFLKQEYKFMTIFMIGFGILISVAIDDQHTPQYNEGLYTALAFLFGGVISVASGYIGMKVATAGNARTTVSAKQSISKAYDVAINSGAVMGFALVGLATLGLIIVYVVMSSLMSELGPDNNHILMEVIAGFGLGGSTIALFARVGGGIFTKAADVGADLVGKVEQGIPEDDPRNPAVIADNVGDNVGDVAGMGADLFGSCAESTCAAMVISAAAFATNTDALLYPILISAVGIPISLLTKLLVSVKTEEDVAPALMKLLIISSALMAVVMYFVTLAMIPADFVIGENTYSNVGVYFCFLSGLVSGLAVGLLTGYYTSEKYAPVQEVAKSCETGVATNIIYGLALGYKSTVLPYICIAISIFVSWELAGMYGVAIASLGMLGTLVIALMIDAYGPVADNAGGIAEMVGLEAEVRRRTDVLDSAGNTTAAIGKGFAIGAAILTSLALFAAFITISEKLSGEAFTMSLLDPLVFTSVFIGAVLPFLFTAMTMKSVGKAAFAMIEEVRHQFRTIPGIMEGTGKPDYAKCVAISTQAALKEMIAPGVLIMGTPLVVGYLFGVEAVAGVLAGSLVCGGVLAISASNSGGAWDNAKKYIEAGNLGGKGSEEHKAAVVGDTVGDPLKDTSGPSLNILIKLSAILSVVFAPFFVQYGGILVG